MTYNGTDEPLLLREEPYHGALLAELGFLPLNSTG